MEDYFSFENNISIMSEKCF